VPARGATVREVPDWLGDAWDWCWRVTSEVLNDLWDWCWDVVSDATLTEVLAAGAAASAIVAFGFWVLEQRRRPELRFMWSFSAAGEVDDLAPWGERETRSSPPGATVLVEASVQNVGDGGTAGAQSNFTVPDAIDCRSAPTSAQPRKAVKVAGAPVAFIPAVFAVPPGDYHLQRFRLRVPNSEGCYRLTFTVTDARLNASGRRFLPSRLVGGDLPPSWSCADPWPPKLPKPFSRWSRVRAEPRGRIAHMRGVRADVRDLHVSTPTSE
jgi:hypothetical protein